MRLARIHCYLIAAVCVGVIAGSINARELKQTPDRFLWPGLEEAKYLMEAPKISPGTALFDSSHSFDALHYRLDMNFPMIDNYFDGRMTLSLEVVDQTISQVRLHMVHLLADSALVNNVPAAFSRDDSTITIHLPGEFNSGDSLDVTVVYHDYTTNRGYFQYDRNAYTMAEPQDARWWFPCFDEPWDKATSEIYATVPIDYDVASNGYLESSIPHPEEQLITYHWVNDYPIATYLINLIMGEFAVWNDYYYISQSDSIPILNMVWREDSTLAAYDFENVPAMMGIFSELFYPYPYNKYGQGAVSPFPYGGMEHQTMTTMNRIWIRGDRYFETAIAHELAHMWWGDYVTMSDWRHIWLNEGFASYGSALFDEMFYGPERGQQDLVRYRQAYLDDVELFGHYPLYDPLHPFGVPVYYKGAWVLHMLRGIIGDYSFFGGLHYYASLYGDGNASTGDFEAAMEDISGMDLAWFFDEWIYGQAHPIYRYSWAWSGDGPYNVQLELSQIQTAAPPFRMPLTLRLKSQSDSQEILINNDLEFQSYNFTIDFQPDSLLLDPDGWVLKEIGAITSVKGEDEAPLPSVVSLGNPYPNPFNGSINIDFQVSYSSARVALALYDISGRRVANICENEYQPGRHSIRFDAAETGNNLASGIYLVNLTSDYRSDSRRITYIK